MKVVAQNVCKRHKRDCSAKVTRNSFSGMPAVPAWIKLDWVLQSNQMERVCLHLQATFFVWFCFILRIICCQNRWEGDEQTKGAKPAATLTNPISDRRLCNYRHFYGLTKLQQCERRISSFTPDDKFQSTASCIFRENGYWSRILFT